MDIAFYNFRLSYRQISRMQLLKFIREWLQWFAIAMAITAILVAITWKLLTTPTSKDSYEATKWQKYQVEIQK